MCVNKCVCVFSNLPDRHQWLNFNTFNNQTVDSRCLVIFSRISLAILWEPSISAALTAPSQRKHIVYWKSNPYFFGQWYLTTLVGNLSGHTSWITNHWKPYFLRKLVLIATLTTGRVIFFLGMDKITGDKLFVFVGSKKRITALNIEHA